MNKISANKFVAQAYKEFAKYTAKTRNYPNLLDGFKMVYRRLLVQSVGFKDLVKSAAIVGSCMQVHPHGDGAIYEALVSATCKYNNFPLFKGKGNFGGLGQSYASMRYTESCLNEIAKLTYLEFLDQATYVDGEVDNKEPMSLPALLSYSLVAGCSGFSVGMPPPNIPQYNPIELIDYYVGYLSGKKRTYPTPAYGRVLISSSRSEVNNILKIGRGKIKFEPIVLREGYNKLVIDELPPLKDISKVLKVLSTEIELGYIEYANESQGYYRFVFTICDSSKITIDQVEAKIKKALSSTVNYRLMFELNGVVYEDCNLDFILDAQLNYLASCVVKKYTELVNTLPKKLQVYEVIDKIKSDTDLLANLKDMSSKDFIEKVTSLGYAQDVAQEVFRMPLSYLTRSHNREVKELKDQLAKYQDYKDNPSKRLLEMYSELRELIVNNYHREMTIYAEDLQKFDKNRCTLDVESQVIKFSTKGTVDWKNLIYLITKDGWVKSYPVSKLHSSDIEISSAQSVEFLSGDTDSNLILISNHQWISVIPIERITSDFTKLVKLWDDFLITDVLTASGNIEVEDIRGNKFTINSEEYVRSRLSRPIKISRYNIKSVKDDASE